MGNKKSKTLVGGNGSKPLEYNTSDEDMAMLDENHVTRLTSMEMNGHWDDEIEYLSEALKGSPYLITKVVEGTGRDGADGADDNVQLHHIGSGEGDDFDITLTRSAIRALSFNTEEGKPDLKSLLQYVDNRPDVRQLQNSLTVDYMKHDYEGYNNEGYMVTGGTTLNGNTIGADYGIDTLALAPVDGSMTSKEFYQRLDGLFNK